VDTKVVTTLVLAESLVRLDVNGVIGVSVAILAVVIAVVVIVAVDFIIARDVARVLF